MNLRRGAARKSRRSHLNTKSRTDVHTVLKRIFDLTDQISILSEEKNQLIASLHRKIPAALHTEWRGRWYSISIRDNAADENRWGQFVYVNRYSIQKRELRHVADGGNVIDQIKRSLKARRTVDRRKKKRG
jgi:hypothetical protein